MRAVIISDTHSMHSHVKLPPGDILIHAGDFTKGGGEKEFAVFGNWLQDLPYEHILVTYGNHDWLGQRDPGLAESLLGRAKVLHEKSIEINGINFYGAAWQPYYGGWAFNVHRDESAVKNWQRIPDNTNVLITHGPPHGTLDIVHEGGLHIDNVGCEALRDRIKSLPNLGLHIFGHIHSCHGAKVKGGITYINAAICNDFYAPSYAPMEFDLDQLLKVAPSI